MKSIVLTFILAWTLNASVLSNDNGRYSMHSVGHKLFILDTQTGKVWWADTDGDLISAFFIAPYTSAETLNWKLKDSINLQQLPTDHK